MKELTASLLALWLGLIGLIASNPALDQFAGYANKGLVGVGRIPADATDSTRLDSLGGVGSAITFDAASWVRKGNLKGWTYKGILYSISDRGPSGRVDYHPRIHLFQISITPLSGRHFANQAQIKLTNIADIFLSYQGTNFTGADPNDLSGILWPISSVNSAGHGHRSIDPEGLARLCDGSFIVADEYGPFLYRFHSSGALLDILRPPPAFIPKRGISLPRTNFFGSTSNPVSGRMLNRGFEGLSLTPDGKRLFSILQAPLTQDGGTNSTNTRLLVWDVEPGSTMKYRPVAEYFYPLTPGGHDLSNGVQISASELLALNREHFLVLERDSLGLEAESRARSSYKRVVLASLHGASNIINTGYDLELEAPGQCRLPPGTIPHHVKPVFRQSFIDLTDPAQISRFGLNTSTNWTTNTLAEKWEGMTLIPLRDRSAPHDFLLLIANDNDFLAHITLVNGQTVSTNTVVCDSMFLAFRVTLPGYAAPSSR